MTSTLHEQPLLPDLVIRALTSRDGDPCIFTGDSVLSYADARQRTSQMVQAMQSVGVRKGSRVAILSKNRPEVLLNAFASLVNRCILTSLHPMASLGDHSYAVNDADRLLGVRHGPLHRTCPRTRRRVSKTGAARFRAE